MAYPVIAFMTSTLEIQLEWIYPNEAHNFLYHLNIAYLSQAHNNDPLPD